MIDDSRTTDVLTEAEATALAALLLGPPAPTYPDPAASDATREITASGFRPTGGSLFGGVIDLRDDRSVGRPGVIPSLFGPTKPAPVPPPQVGSLFPPRPDSAPPAMPKTAGILWSRSDVEAPPGGTNESSAARLALPTEAQPVGFIPADPDAVIEVERGRGRTRLLVVLAAVAVLVVGGVAVSALSGPGDEGASEISVVDSVPPTAPTTVPTTVPTTAVTVPATETTVPTTAPVVETTVPAVTAAAPPPPEPRRTPTTVRRRTTTTAAPSTSAETVPVPVPNAPFSPPTWTAPPTTAAPTTAAPTTAAPTTAAPTTAAPAPDPAPTDPPGGEASAD